MTEAPTAPAAPKPKTLADLNKDDRSEIKTGQAMSDMMNLDGWKFYQKILGLQLEAKRREIEVAQPVPGEDGQAYMLRMERAKGTIIGLRLALEQPQIMMTTAKELRDRLLGTGSEE